MSEASNLDKSIIGFFKILIKKVFFEVIGLKIIS